MAQIQEALGRNAPFVKVQSPPIIAQRAPATTDTNYPKGQGWIDESVSPAILYFHIGGGDWNSNELTLSTDDTFAGALDTTASSSLAIKTYVDGVAVAGAPNASTTVKGIVEEGTDAQVVAGTTTGETGARLFVNPGSLSALFAAAPAIGGTTPAAGAFTTLGATGAVDFDAGGSWESGGAAIDIGADASTDALNIGTGAAARTITIGNVSGATAVAINTGTGHFTVTTTGTGDIILNSDDTMLLDSDGVLELNSSAGVISIGNDDVDQNINLGTDGERVITIGSNNGAAQVDLESGSGGINIGASANAQSITIGNVTGATALILNCGTGNFALEGNVASTYNISASGANTGTITIGGGTGAQTLNLMTGGTGVKTVNIGTGAIGNVVTIGTVTGAASLDLKCGTGNFTLEGNVASTYDISATGVNTGTVRIGSGTGARTVEIAGGGTGAKTINIGAAASADVITIGSSDGAGSLDLACGTGNFTLEGATATTYNISATGANTGTITIGGGTGAQTLNLMTGGTGIKTVNIGTGAIDNVVTVGTVTGAASLDLKCGTGNFTLEGNVASTYDISATGANTGTITIGGGTGAQTLNLATGGTGVKTVNIATAAIDNVVTIGTVTGAASLDLKCGTGNFTLEGDVASTYEISSTGANTGTCKFASGTGARTVEIAGGGTGIKTINIGAAATADVITIGTTTAAGSTTLAAGSGGIIHSGPCVYTPDAITADNAGTAASILTKITEITTDGDANLDNVTVGAGVDGQVKIFVVVAVGNAGDSLKITPASLIGGTQITFPANPLGLGCAMVYDAGAAGWIIYANNGGTIA